jgi:signal transduction histidine kinase
MRLQAGDGAVVAGVVAVLVTAAAVGHDSTTGSDVAQATLDSAAATTGVLLSYVLLGRFWETRRVRDLCLCGFLLLLGLSNALFAVLPRALGHAGTPRSSAVAGVLAGAAFLAATRLPAWTVRWSTGSAVVATCAVVVAGLGTAVVATVPPGSGWLTGVQLLGGALFLAGAVSAVRSDDPLFLWLAPAGVLGAGFRLDYAISSSRGDAWAVAGLVLRSAFYLLLLIASAVEIRSYWQRVAQVAVLEERRRIARDLHDGLAQELAFASTQSRALAERSEHPKRAQLIAAATERALDESRRAIAALTRPLDESLAASVAQCAEEVCGRFDTGLVLDLDDDVAAASDTREALLRILREAVANSARHSGAAQVRVRLRRGAQLELRVEDDGRGFDVDDIEHLSGRFGLISMRERAHALGGTFTVVSRLQGGTAIEVTLP